MSVIVGLLLLAFQTQPSESAPGAGSHTVPTVVRKDYDMRQLATEGSLTETELAGRRLFAQRCGICHDPVGQGRTPGPWLDRETVNSTGEAKARQMIATGSRRMPGFQYALQTAQIDQIVAFMKTISPDQKPAPAPPRR